MFCDFEKICHPTAQEQIEQLKQIKETILSIPEGKCSICKYYIPPDQNLPAWYIDYGQCSKNMEQLFYLKVCSSAECPYYEKNTALLDSINKKIKELLNATSEAT